MAVILRKPFNRPTYYASRWGLQAYWNLQNVNDAYANAQTLTNNAGVTFTAGLIGNSATLAAASSQFLSRASNAILRTGDVDWWISAWAKLASVGSSRHICSKETSGGATEWNLATSVGTDLFRFDFGAGAAVSGIAASAGVWYHVFAWRDRSARTTNISIDNAAPASTTTTSVPTPNTGGMSIGRVGDRNLGYWNGQIASVAIGKDPATGLTPLVSEIRSTLYNAGVGRVWPF